MLIHSEMNKLLITGSTGFIGKNLINQLGPDHQILEITRSIKKSNELFGNRTSKLEVEDSDFNEKIADFNPDVVLHLAAYLTASDNWDDVEKLVNTNLLFTAKVLDAVAKLPINLFVNTGSFAEYHKGDNDLLPAYFYAATKTASRALINYYSSAYEFKQSTIVPYTVYGRGDSQKKIIDLIFESTVASEPLHLSPGEQVLDFIHINDVVNFYLCLLNKFEELPNISEFKLGTGKGTTLKELACLVEKITGEKTNINWGGKPYRESDVMYAVADINKNKQLLNWTPLIGIEEGIKLFKQ